MVTLDPMGSRKVFRLRNLNKTEIKTVQRPVKNVEAYPQGRYEELIKRGKDNESAYFSYLDLAGKQDEGDSD